MEHEIQYMITDRVCFHRANAIQEERRVQHRSNHMTEMLNEGLPSFEMGIDENGKKVVVLKGTPKRVGIGKRGHREESGTDKQRAQR